MLTVSDLTVKYGNVTAVCNVTFEVHTGEIVCLLGANGAGKSTILRTLSGILQPESGRILFEGKDLRRVPSHRIVAWGVAHVPEGRQIFPDLTVLENLRMGAYLRKNTREIHGDLERVLDHFPKLKDRLGQVGGTLSGGEQQMLAIGRGLMSHPRLLILDEPSLGLAPIIVEAIFKIIRDLNREGMTILLVEQNSHLSLEIAGRAYVLEMGQVKLSGPAQELADNPQIQEAYLGSPAAGS